MIWKVCAIPDVHTARLCADLGADMLGLHAIDELDETSAQTYSAIIEEMSLFNPRVGAVLVTKQVSAQAIGDMVLRTGAQYVQLHRPFKHGTLEMLIRSVRQLVGHPLGFISVIAAEDTTGIEYARRLTRAQDLVDYFLVDTSWEGGTGRVASRSAAEELLAVLPRERTLIAGGITAENVADLVARFRPGGVDVQSGLEIHGTKHKKNPALLASFSKEIGVEPSRQLFRTPQRPLVSLACSHLTEDEITSALGRYRAHVPDLIHWDFSDGTIAPEVGRNLISTVGSLGKIHPCMPYDVHLLVQSPSRYVELLRESREINPLLRVAYIHWETIDSAALSSLVPFARAISRLQIGLGVALHSTRLDVQSLRNLLPRFSLFPIVDVSLVTHSARHRLDVVEAHDKPLLKLLADWASQQRTPLHISVDRDMSIDKLRIFSTCAPSHVILGKYLLGLSSPSEAIKLLKEYLQKPFGSPYP